MDYLRTLGSSLVQKSGLTLPFTLGQKIISYENRSIWTLYDATKREDGSLVSVFEFDANSPSKRNLLPLAKNALRKLRTIRHPDVLKYIDAVETDTTIHIMTERIRPLSSALSEYSAKSPQEREDWLMWGLHRISVALSFINDSCASTHGNVRVDSVFISPSGEWKLGGFEVLSSPKDDAAVLYTMNNLLPDTNMYSSPEVKKEGGSVLKDNPVAAVDAYSLGLLIHFVFNPSQSLPATAQPPHPPPTAASRGSIPVFLFPSYKRLLNPNPKARLSPKNFLELGMAETAGEGSGFFASNRLVKVCAGLDQFNLMNESEKGAFLRTLKESATSFPPEFASFRVLPSLSSALEFGGASAAAILPLVLQLGKAVASADYASVIIVHLVRLFPSPDRGTRMALLDHLSEYSDKLDKKTVVDKIWPHLQTGFTDTVALIREATVKSIILLADKLNERILNNELLRHLAKLQVDPEASIRTNTCILLGRLGPSLGYHTKRKVLVSAFARSLKDPFVHTRVAALMAFMATVECYDIEELAGKVIPNMAFAMVDKEKLVRDQAFKAMELFIKRLEVHASTMPETVISENDNAVVGGFPLPTSPGGNTLVNGATGAAGALAGWAISSLSRKLVAADLQSTIGALTPGAGIERPTSTPPPVPDGLGPRPSPLNQTLSSPATARVVPKSNMRLGASSSMHLGTPRKHTGMGTEWAQEVIAAEVEHDHDGGPSNLWGSDDLMDVNADQDDWSAFETAPQPSVPAIGLGLGDMDGYSNGTSTDAWKGFGSANDAGNEWDSIDTKPAPVTVAPRPRKPSSAVHTLSAQRSPPVRSITPSEMGGAMSSRGSSPVPASATTSTTGMSKEDKAAEMARRKEERKQRIAALKEKKNANSAKS